MLPRLPEGGLRKLVRVSLVLLVLLLPWPGLRPACGWVLRGMGNLLVADTTFGAGGQISLARSEVPEPDTIVTLYNTRSGSGFHVPLDSRMLLWAPNAVFLALCIGWRWLRPAAFAVGLLAVEVYVAAACTLPPLTQLLDVDFGVYRAPPAIRLAATLVYRVLVNPPGFVYLVPAIIWTLTLVKLNRAAPPSVAGGQKRRAAG